jgi:hypothetical protein
MWLIAHFFDPKKRAIRFIMPEADLKREHGSLLTIKKKPMLA